MILEVTTPEEIKRRSLDQYKDRKAKAHTTKRGRGRIAMLRLKKKKKA